MNKPPTHPRRSAWAALPGVEPVPFGSKGCKWPLSLKDADGVSMACGAQRAAPDEPYCKAHLKMGTNPRIEKGKAKPKAEAF